MNHSGIMTVKTQHFEMDYIRFGSGERSFVIIPGVSIMPVTLSADAIADAFSQFGEMYTVYLFDRKKNIDAPYSISEMADDTAQAMKMLGIENADIYAVSQGGMIALTMAVKYPELIHAMYLSSTLSRPNDLMRKTASEWIRLAESGDITALNHGVNTKVYSDEFYKANESFFRESETIGDEADVKRFRFIVSSLDEYDVYDRLSLIKCPVFITASRRDKVLGYEGSVEIAEKLGCSIKLYEGYGHAVYDEAPDFRRDMLEALKSVY